MAIPPTIPTSFVPHPGSDGPRRYTSNLSNAFAFLAYGVLGVAVLLAIGVFVYQSVLSSQKAAKDTALAKAQASIDPATAEQFVRLSDRLSNSTQLLTGHIAFSHVFTELATVLPTSVRLTNITLSIDDKGTVTLQGSGVAKSFNALAVASDALAKDGQIKDAIFSGITVQKNTAVSFTLSATVDPKLIAYAAAAGAPAPTASAPTASTTPAATTTAP